MADYTHDRDGKNVVVFIDHQVIWEKADGTVEHLDVESLRILSEAYRAYLIMR